MTRAHEEFLTMMKAYLQETVYEPGQDIDWNQIVYYAGIHYCSGVLYYMLKKLPPEKQPDAAVMMQLKKKYRSNLVISQIREAGIGRIFQELDAVNIPVCVVKGFVTRDYYPVREMREMSDVDTVVAPSDLKKAHEVMMNLGCTAGEEKGYEWTYFYMGIRVEIHSNLFPETSWNDVDYGAYFEDAMLHTRKRNQVSLELTPEYHFIFMLVHMAKHFNAGGTGIHMMTDIGVFLKRFDRDLDWNWLWRELEKLKLRVLAEHIIQLSQKWFGIGSYTVTTEISEDFYEELTEAILDGGIFGYADTDREARRLRRGFSGDGAQTGFWVSIKALFRNLFPDRRFMCRYLESLKTRPYLLPIAWIKRWKVVLCTRRSEIGGALRMLFKGGKEASKQHTLLSRLGMF